VRFEWDRDKAVSNLAKHAISFEEAVSVFYDPLAASFEDPDHSLSEGRWITVGYSVSGRLLIVWHTDRRGGVRLIGARRATRREKERHEAQS
jgi:uncharacterized DUF497 family protein